MKIKIYGSGNEVGRSCIELELENKRYLLDAGLKITPNEAEFPLDIPNIEEIRAIFISHIHLDHTGGLPHLFSKGLNCPIYASSITRDLLPTLLKDSWKVSKINNCRIEYTEENIQNVIGKVKVIKESLRTSVDNGQVMATFLCAGHVPGAQSIFLEIEGRKIVYSGDINLSETLITFPLNVDEFPKEPDLLILESTYGNKSHIDRETTIEELIKEIKGTLNRGGIALIPTFSIGRAQELIMILRDSFPKEKIILDGMAKTITQTYIDNGDIKNLEKLKKSFKSITTTKNQRNRKDEFQNSRIIVTTSGMLDGGPVLYYLQKIAKDDNSAILLTGYQAEETNGRRVLSEGKVLIDGKNVEINCEVKQYDLSAHAGLNQLSLLVEKIKPKAIILNHGEGDSINYLKKTIEDKYNIKCYIPKNGEEVLL